MPQTKQHSKEYLDHVERTVDSYFGTWVEEEFDDQRIAHYGFKVALNQFELEELRKVMRKRYSKKLIIGIQQKRISRGRGGKADSLVVLTATRRNRVEEQRWIFPKIRRGCDN